MGYVSLQEGTKKQNHTSCQVHLTLWAHHQTIHQSWNSGLSMAQCPAEWKLPVRDHRKAARERWSEPLNFVVTIDWLMVDCRFWYIYISIRIKVNQRFVEILATNMLIGKLRAPFHDTKLTCRYMPQVNPPVLKVVHLRRLSLPGCNRGKWRFSWGSPNLKM